MCNLLECDWNRKMSVSASQRSQRAMSEHICFDILLFPHLEFLFNINFKIILNIGIHQTSSRNKNILSLNLGTFYEPLINPIYMASKTIIF